MAKFSKSEQEALRNAVLTGLAAQLASNARANGATGLDAVRAAEAEIIRRHRAAEASN